MKLHRTNYRPSRSQQLLLVDFFKAKYHTRSPYETIVVHHVLEDSPIRLYLQIERRCPINGIKFERVEI